MSITYKSLLCEVQPKYITTNRNRCKITSAEDAYNEVKHIFDMDTIEYQEQAIVLYLNRSNNTVGVQALSKGGIAGTVVDGKIIFTMALQTGASSIILAHNHPSSNLQPSTSDIKLTNDLKYFGKMINISIIDHLIVNKESFLSFANEDLI